MMKHLIAEAVALGGGDLCASGHDWKMEGGRTCPKYEAAGCSQTVYVCARCGAYDHGEKGGPAHRECYSECGRDFADEIAEEIEIAAEIAAENEKYRKPPCQRCGAMTPEEAEAKCRVGGGDDDHCHGGELWPD